MKVECRHCMDAECRYCGRSLEVRDKRELPRGIVIAAKVWLLGVFLVILAALGYWIATNFREGAWMVLFYIITFVAVVIVLGSIRD